MKKIGMVGNVMRWPIGIVFKQCILKGGSAVFVNPGSDAAIEVKI